MTTRHLTDSRNASALMVALITVAVLISLGSASFLVINNKYRAVHQAASWQEALLTAEGGIDMAMTEIRKQLWDPSNAWRSWSTNSTEEETIGTAPDPGDSPVYRTSEVLLREGEGGTSSYAVVTVDAPNFLKDSSGEQWYRIRSRGICEVSGGRVAAGESKDIRLRKFDLRHDRLTNSSVATPQASRMIEAIAKPQGAFRLALFGVKGIDMTNHNIVVDSYDSRDAGKSTNNFYDPAKRQWNGDIATNGSVINAGQARIYGTASTNGGNVLNADNITGNDMNYPGGFQNNPDRIRDDFYQEVVTVIAPIVTASPGTPSIINNATTIAASAGDPTQVIVSSINLSGQSTLRITGAADGSPTYAQFIVSGSVSLSGQAEIILDPGVHVRMFVRGDADITGNGISNPGSPLMFQYYGLDRPKLSDDTEDIGEIKIAGNGGFRGTVYAPNYDVTIVGGGNSDSIYGSFVGNTIFMNGVQSLHYDEALADGGLITGYNIVSWFEDER